MTKIGYARISSSDQNLSRQLDQLQNCEKIFQEAISGVSKERPQLKAMLDYIREGDIVVVTELERLGRNNKELTEIMAVIQTKRERIKERQKQGIAIAKFQGKYRGRKTLYTADDERLQHAFELYRKGYTDKDVAKLTGINERTFRRYRDRYNVKR